MSTMQITREDLNRCTVKLDIVCTPEQVKDGFSRAYKGLAKKVKVPGFRPGAAPKSMIEQMVSRDQINQAAAEEIINRATQQAIKQENLKASDTPAVSLRNLSEEMEACEFTLKIPLDPIVELGEYKGLTATRPPVAVTDEDVETQLESLRRRSGEREDVVDRGVEPGDVAVVNVKVQGEAGDGRNFMTIAGQTFPAFDEALAGMRVEEMKALTLEFPKKFQEADWAGKTLACQLTLRSLNTIKLPELDDDFAQKLKAKDLKELQRILRERIAEAKASVAQDYVNEQLQEELLRRCRVEVPDNMWESVASRRLQDLQQDVAQRGMTVEQYAQANGMTIEQLVEAWKQESKTHVMRAVVIRDIFVKEKMRLTNADFNNALTEMAREYDMEPESLFAALKKNRSLRELEFRAIFNKVIGFLNEHATIAEGK
jgi:trigger factor